MPTHEEFAQFLREFAGLTPAQQDLFIIAVKHMVEGLRKGQGFRSGLRVKAVKKRRGDFEITWAPDGRATFHYGPEKTSGDPHIVWRRIGNHDILNNP